MKTEMMVSQVSLKLINTAYHWRHCNIIVRKNITCDLHCSTATPDVHRQRHLFLTVQAAVTPTNVLPAPGNEKIISKSSQ
jgi:hypothetical protein